MKVKKYYCTSTNKVLFTVRTVVLHVILRACLCPEFLSQPATTCCFSLWNKAAFPFPYFLLPNCTDLSAKTPSWDGRVHSVAECRVRKGGRKEKKRVAKGEQGFFFSLQGRSRGGGSRKDALFYVCACVLGRICNMWWKVTFNYLCCMIKFGFFYMSLEYTQDKIRRVFTSVGILSRVTCSDVIWHFSEPVFTNLALFEMVWHQFFFKFIYCLAKKMGFSK